MQTNTDLFTPVHMATSNALLYPLNDGDQKFDAFEMDGFAVPEIDYPAITSFCPIPEETLLDPLFSPVDTAPSGSRFSLRKQLPCDLCSETFSSAQVLRLHRREKHIATKEFRCRKCPMSFNFESNLVLHMASHVPVQSVDKECPECSMVFKRISSFKGHLKSHQTNDRFKCNRCDKEFDLKGYYEKHLAKAHKPGADGTVEEISAKVENSVRSRSKAKKPQGKYQCEACGKSFPKPCLLKRHEVAHTGARPFKCAECDQGFTQKTSLERHMLLHQGIKDFKCPKCNAGFSQKNNLIVHIKRTHPVHQNTENMFACEYCPCVFTKLNSVNRHKAMAHADRANAADHDGFNDDDDDNVNIARVMEQLKSFQESMGIRDMQPPALELSLMKPPSPGPKVRTVTLIDTLNPKKEKTYKTVKEIEYKGQRTMACIYCDKTFKRQFDLLRHHRTHTKERPFECEICQKSFATNAALKIHHNIHLSSQDKPAKVYTCAAPECGKRFSSMRRLDIHTKTHTSGISYICPLCSKTFTSKAGFSAHKHQPNDKEFDMIRPLLMPPVNIESNSADEAEKADEYSKRCHQCCVCGLKMKKLSHLRQHEATHKGDKPFKCTVCFRSYTTQSSLNLHKQIHAAEKRYICEVCDAKFITQSLLKRHMISHSDERKFECPYCSERFKTSDNCKNHILTHGRNLLASPEPPPEEENPWRVESGEAEEEGEAEGLGTISQPCIAVVQSEQSNMSPKFIQIEMVKNCRRHNHTNLTIETVPSTPKKSAKRSLARSLKQISQPGHQCGECRKTFYKASDLERHARTHTKEKPFACSLCAKTFALMSTLVQHRKTHDTLRETYDCQVCGKKYTSKKVLVVHLRLHTGERPFQCGVCQKTFRTSGHKISHMKSHHKKRK